MGNARAVRNVETGEVFASVTSAAESCGVTVGTMVQALTYSYRAAGCHWEYLSGRGGELLARKGRIYGKKR